MPIEFKELFFSDPRVQVDPVTGHIWKPVLRAGEWKVGPNGKPLVVIAGRSLDQTKAIGLQDIVDNFKSGVIEHVTIPLSHDDKVDENTGHIRDLRIHAAGDDTLLMAAHDFTEPDVKGKVERGTIPNTSVGLEFDYTHKESGKKIPVVLKHVALTHRPWINKLAPFGVTASEVKEGDYVIETAEFSEVLKPEAVAHFSVSAWDTESDIEKIRAKIKTKLGEEFEPAVMARDSVLVRSKDGKQFVVNYSVDGADVSLAQKDQWVEHTAPAPSTPPASAPDATIPPSTDPPKEPTAVTPTDTPELIAAREALAASEAARVAAETKLAEQAAETTALKGAVSVLTEKDRKNDAEAFLTTLRSMGLSEENGCTDLLVYLRDLRLSDEGQATILLSEGTDQTPKPFTVTQIVEKIFSKLPTEKTTGRLAMALSEQTPADPLHVTSLVKPPLVGDDGKDLVEGTPEYEQHMDALFSEMYPGTTLAA